MSRSQLAPCLVAAALAAAATAQNVPTGFTVDTLLTTGLSTPNDCCFLPDGRCLIANSGGSVVLYTGSGSATIGTVPNVNSGGEQGMLSIAADPAFATNGFFYVYYTSSTTSFVHVDRFACTGDLANPASTTLSFSSASRTAILGALPDNAGNHNGGSLRFGPDGKLWITIGDDANACNAQSLTSQAGCLLRIDPSLLPATPSTVLPAYSAIDPGDNPNSAAADFSQLVVANGLRNPFRAEIDPLTGNVYIGDVGAGSVEEYSEYVRGVGNPTLVNFGWPWREGNIAGSSCGGSQPAGLVDPIGAVSHGGGWAAVMGGARYRNLGGQYDFGPTYEGNAFYLDYYAGQVRRLVNNAGVWSPAPVAPGQPDATNWGTNFGSVTSLRLGPDGALWLTQHPGSLKRVRLIGPVPSISAISGGGQRVTAGDPFVQPIVARVFDPQGNPLPNGLVNFAASGGITLSTTNPVVADANGYAQTFATATSAGGAATVTASTPGGVANATFSLFARRLTVTAVSNLLVVSVVNQTSAVPASVPYLVMLSFPGGPTSVPTAIGNLCIDPSYSLAFVIEDSVGLFGGVSYSGTGAVGSPGINKLYTVPVGLFTGQQMRFQVIGFDSIDGWFRTNCEIKNL
ncbi:MAG: PQQ-dependent sugar dehydrogenase [Planctomycetes bacterium]|nr:PQQ-dependent sugar dehydrogenase [Planctomycetota bacterium]